MDKSDLTADSGYIPSSYGIWPMSTINISSNADTTRHHQNIESVEINRWSNQTNWISNKETNICTPQWEIQNLEHSLEIKEKA